MNTTESFDDSIGLESILTPHKASTMTMPSFHSLNIRNFPRIIPHWWNFSQYQNWRHSPDSEDKGFHQCLNKSITCLKVDKFICKDFRNCLCHCILSLEGKLKNQSSSNKKFKSRRRKTELSSRI